MKFPRPLPLEKRLNKETKMIMFQKANMSALTGAPLSWLLNIIFTIPIVEYGVNNEWNSLVTIAVLWIPFYLASVQRMFTVDLIYALYNVNIDPSYLVKKLVCKARGK